MLKKKCLIIFMMLILMIIVILIIKYYGGEKVILPKDEALKIGEEKYQQFLWIIDGAFNDSRYQDSFFVNGVEIQKKNQLIKCNYTNKKSCVVKDFSQVFTSLFASNIKMDIVYGDGLSFKWYDVEDNQYIFTNMNNCSISRMGLFHQIEVSEITEDKIIYQVSFSDTSSDDSRHIVKKFILIKENDDWKISKAYYHDLCHMDYFIE